MGLRQRKDQVWGVLELCRSPQPEPDLMEVRKSMPPALVLLCWEEIKVTLYTHKHRKKKKIIPIVITGETALLVFF